MTHTTDDLRGVSPTKEAPFWNQARQVADLGEVDPPRSTSSQYHRAGDLAKWPASYHKFKWEHTLNLADSARARCLLLLAHRIRQLLI